MFVIVSLKLDLDATARLSHMENQIEEAGRAASDGRALKQAIRAAEEQEKRCPKCGERPVPQPGNEATSVTDPLRRVEVLSSG